MELAEHIIKVAALLTAIAGIIGFAYKAFKWFAKQDKQTDDINALRDKHDKDLKEAKSQEAQDMQEIKDELCVVSYALLAALDGLMQKGCNGNVTKAHNLLEKHLNKKAHGQRPEDWD